MESIWFASCPIERREPAEPEPADRCCGNRCRNNRHFNRIQASKNRKRGGIAEANRIAKWSNGETTAKITSQHGLLYHRLIQDGGEEKARQYAHGK